MPLIPASSAAPSKRPYAFKLGTLAQDDHGRWRSEAIWLGRKGGQTRISYGELRFWWQGRELKSNEPSLSFAELAVHCDERYGGDPWYVCNEDGNLWVNPASLTPKPSLTDQVKIAEELTAMLGDLPNVPGGFDGWYQLVSDTRSRGAGPAAP